MKKDLLLISLLLVIIIFAPFGLLWALNTIFPVLSIPYNLETWGASVIISALFASPKGR